MRSPSVRRRDGGLSGQILVEVVLAGLTWTSVNVSRAGHYRVRVGPIALDERLADYGVVEAEVRRTKLEPDEVEAWVNKAECLNLRLLDRTERVPLGPLWHYRRMAWLELERDEGSDVSYDDAISVIIDLSSLLFPQTRTRLKPVRLALHKFKASVFAEVLKIDHRQNTADGIDRSVRRHTRASSLHKLLVSVAHSTIVSQEPSKYDCAEEKSSRSEADHSRLRLCLPTPEDHTYSHLPSLPSHTPPIASCLFTYASTQTKDNKHTSATRVPSLLLQALLTPKPSFGLRIMGALSPHPPPPTEIRGRLQSINQPASPQPMLTDVGRPDNVSAPREIIDRIDPHDSPLVTSEPAVTADVSRSEVTVREHPIWATEESLSRWGESSLSRDARPNDSRAVLNLSTRRDNMNADVSAVITAEDEHAPGGFQPTHPNDPYHQLSIWKLRRGYLFK